MKTAYDLPDTGTVLVTIPPNGIGLSHEINNINRLKMADLPTANILDVGNYHGSEAMVMEKFVDVIKPMPPDTASGEDFVNSKLTNHRTLDSLIEIRNTIAREKIVVLDLQFGIRGASKPNLLNLGNKPGSLAVLDPLQVMASEVGFDNKPQLEVLDELIVAIRKRLNSAKLAA